MPSLRSDAAAVRLAPVCLVAVLSFAATSAAAVEWSLGGALSQTFDYDTNFGLGTDDEEDDPSFGTRTGLNLSLGAETDTTAWRLGSGFNYTFRTDRDDNDATNGIRPNIAGSVSHGRPGYSLTSSFRYVRRSTEETRFVPFIDDPSDPDDAPDDDGFIDDGRRVRADTVQTNFNYSAGASFVVTPRDSVNVSGSVAVVRFSEDLEGRVPAESFRGTLGWSRSLSPVSSAGASVSVLRFNSENAVTPEQETGTSTSFSLNYSTQPTPRHGVNVSAGFSYTDETSDELIGPFLVRQEESNLGFNGGVGFSYRRLRDSFSLSAGQSVRPSTFGNLRNVTSLRAGYNRQLTEFWNFSLSSVVAFDSDAAFPTEANDLRVGVSPSLSYQITRDLSLGLSYGFRYIDEEEAGGSTISNRVALTLRQSFDIFP